MKIIYVIFIAFVWMELSCSSKITLIRDIDNENVANFENDEYMIVFEYYFKDSIQINYNSKKVFNNYVETNKRLGASEKFCIIKSNSKKERIDIWINKKQHFYFIPKKEYAYYYLTRNSKLGVTYSNVLREYY